MKSLLGCSGFAVVFLAYVWWVVWLLDHSLAGFLAWMVVGPFVVAGLMRLRDAWRRARRER